MVRRAGEPCACEGHGPSQRDIGSVGQDAAALLKFRPSTLAQLQYALKKRRQIRQREKLNGLLLGLSALRF